MKRRRVALLFCGATELVRSGRRIEPIRTPAAADRWMERSTELDLIAELSPVFVTGKPAGDFGVAEWTEIARTCQRILCTVDGIVILHGAESFEYTANALSLMARSLPIPIVLAPTPERVASDPVGRASAINAVQAATADIAEVCAVSGNAIVRASRIQNEQRTDRSTLLSDSVIGRVDFGLRLLPAAIRRKKRSARWAIGLDPNIFITSPSYGSGASSVRSAVADGAHGILVFADDAFPSLPNEFQAALEVAGRKGVVVAFMTDRRLRKLPAGFVQLVGITRSMAAVKLMWSLAMTRKSAEARALLSRNVAHEFPDGGRT